MKLFRLFIQPTEKCMTLLRYVDENINTINQLGVKILVRNIGGAEVDEELIEKFRKIGIARLPALVSPDGQIFVGQKEIIRLLKRNVSKTTEFPSMFGGDSDTDSFWRRELFTREKSGKIVARADTDTAEDEVIGRDIEKKMHSYQRQAKERRAQEFQDEEEGNIGPTFSIEPPMSSSISSGVGAAENLAERSSDNEIDRRIMAAWLNNNPD